MGDIVVRVVTEFRKVRGKETIDWTYYYFKERNEALKLVNILLDNGYSCMIEDRSK